MFKALQIFERTAGQHGLLGDALIVQAAILQTRGATADAQALAARAAKIWDLSAPSPSRAAGEALETVLQGGAPPDTVANLKHYVQQMQATRLL